MSAEGARVPELMLEQYALGELSEAERLAVAAALGSDASLRVRLAELEASDETILSEAPPAEIAAAIRRRMLSSRRGGSGAFKPVSALLFPAAAVLLVLVGSIMSKGILLPSAGDLTRPKGGVPGISVYKKAASGAEELGDGASVAVGDVLQIRYAAGCSGYGAIFSLDGRGTLTRHLPSLGAVSGTRAPRLAEEGAVLASAYELDDAPGFERFFIVTSSGAFDLAVVADALRDLAAAGPGADTRAPRLPGGLEWKSLLLRKTGGRQ
jgi:hypothetical protein